MDRRRRKKPGDPIAEREAFYAAVASGTLTLAETVRRMRKLTRLTQPEYAKLVGVAPRVLIDLERGLSNPTLATLTKIARPFGLQVALVRKPVAEET